MKRIQTRDELVQFARDMRVRPNWHEPDEQGLTADVFGRSFDNAGLWPLERCLPGSMSGTTYSSDPERSTEMYVVLYQSDDSSGTTRTPMAAVNLATLLAWASGYDDE